MIDEKVLICQIKDFTKHLNVNSVNSDYLTGYISALSAIEKMLASQPKVGEWIPCSDRLPDNTDNVLITTQYGVVLIVFLGTSKKWCYLSGKRMDSQDEPIAWMPLPEPYRKDGDSDETD